MRCEAHFKITGSHRQKYVIQVINASHNTDLERLAIEKGTIIRSQNSDSKACQLARFTEASAIETDLITSSPGHDKRCFVLWKNTKEEAVLNVPGVLVEAAIPPIIGGHQ